MIISSRRGGKHTQPIKAEIGEEDELDNRVARSLCWREIEMTAGTKLARRSKVRRLMWTARVIVEIEKIATIEGWI